MASFTVQQINTAKVLNLNVWNSKGGWKEVHNMTMNTADYIKSNGIYSVYVEINGIQHHFFSKGAKAYGVEYLD